MKRPGNPLKEHELFEIAAAEIESKCFCLQQAMGILATYQIDSSWVKESMSPKQIANAVWARADKARYIVRYNIEIK